MHLVPTSHGSPRLIWKVDGILGYVAAGLDVNFTLQLESPKTNKELLLKRWYILSYVFQVRNRSTKIYINYINMSVPFRDTIRTIFSIGNIGRPFLRGVQ